MTTEYLLDHQWMIIRHILVPRAVIDTTVAGDSFIGGFLLSLSQQSQALSLDKALTNEQIITAEVMFSVKFGAYTCQQKGAFSSLPDIHSID